MDSSLLKENIIKKMYDGMGEVFEDYLSRFKSYSNGNKENSTDVINNLSKISGSLGYIGQVHASLAKAYEHEKRLLDLEEKFGKIPPGFLKGLDEKSR